MVHIYHWYHGTVYYMHTSMGTSCMKYLNFFHPFLHYHTKSRERFFPKSITSGTESTTPKAFSRWLMYQYHLGTVNVKYFFFEFQVCFKNRLSFQVPGTNICYMVPGIHISFLVVNIDVEQFSLSCD